MIVIFTLFLNTSFHSHAQNHNNPINLKELETKLASGNYGDTLFIKSGIYKDVEVSLTARPDKMIYIMPYKNGEVTISGNSTLKIGKSKNISLQGILFSKVKNGSALIIDSSNNIEISNNYFLECGSNRFGFILRIDGGSSENKISYNTFDSSRAMSVVVVASLKNINTKNSVNNIISNNLFYNIASVKSIYPNSDGNGMEAIQIGQGRETSHWNSSTIISHNLFENIVGDGSEIISNKTSGNKILENTFLNNRSGISIRVGDNVEIKGNYLYNTTRGIRVFGYGQVIENNFIENPNVGIELPSTDVKNSEKMMEPGYYQQENVNIENNVIKYPKSAAFLIGNGTRKLFPKNITITNNKILVDKSTVSFNIINSSPANEPIKIFNNINLKENLMGQIFNSAKIKTLNNLRVEEVTGTEPFKSKDNGVGANWKRPK